MFQPLKRFRVFLLVTFASISLLAQTGSSAISITPATSTMQIGDSRQFRVVDAQGRVQNNVQWAISDPNAFGSTEKSDELDLAAKQAGTYRISARAGDRAAVATIKVVEAKAPGSSLIAQSHGCRVLRIAQAPYSYDGPYMYEQLLCDDGMYIAAYTESGVQLWQRKIAEVPGIASTLSADQNPPPSTRLDTKSTSVCDALTVGTEQEKVKELLKSRSLSYTQDPRQRQTWVVEETNTECKLWFDGKSVLTKKQKTLVAQ